MTGRVALVTGPNGQDGSYLVERLLAEGTEVHGLVRAEDVEARTGPGVHQHVLDLSSPAPELRALVRDVAPNEVYNLGGLSSVARSWAEPSLAAQVSGVAPITLLEACCDLQEATGTSVRFLQASSAEIFGHPAVSPQDEFTPIAPVSPYGAAKALAHHSVTVFRHRGLHAVSAILYNHESPRRPHGFVTRKIASGVVDIVRGLSDHLALGNLEARRDWGWAPDFVDAMVRAVRHDEADDYVIATGVDHSVGEFVAAAFARVGIEDWAAHVVIDPAFFRPADPGVLVGDPPRARTVLGWEPTHGFADVVAAMVDHERERTDGR